MPGGKPLAVPSDIVYHYDGGLKGLYSCVHACVYSGRLPMAIWPAHEAQPSLLPAQWVDTDEEKAHRVRTSIGQKISTRAQELVETVFMSCLPQKEMPLLRFLLLGYQEGGRVTNMLAHPDVSTLLKAEQHLYGEAHLLKGFVRFADYDGRLVATIKPKNFVLPYIAEHFTERYANEQFMIYDRVNHAALIHADRQAQIVPMDALPALEESDEERMYQGLWKQFYHTIGIQSRANPRCRMTHMPKRYWSEMTEMKELL